MAKDGADSKLPLKLLLAMCYTTFPRKNFLIVSLVLLTQFSMAQRQMENLGRGVVAVRNEIGNVFVSWRQLATDPDGSAFNIYRSSANNKWIKLNRQSITSVTHFIDTTATSNTGYSYLVKPDANGKEQGGGKFILQPGNAPYFSIPLQTPTGYAPN